MRAICMHFICNWKTKKKKITHTHTYISHYVYSYSMTNGNYSPINLLRSSMYCLMIITANNIYHRPEIKEKQTICVLLNWCIEFKILCVFVCEWVWVYECVYVYVFVCMYGNVVDHKGREEIKFDHNWETLLAKWYNYVFLIFVSLFFSNWLVI